MMIEEEVGINEEFMNKEDICMMGIGLNQEFMLMKKTSSYICSFKVLLDLTN